MSFTMRFSSVKILPFPLLLIAVDCSAGFSFGNDQFQFSSYGSLNSNIGSNFNYLVDDGTKFYGESTINYSNERYLGTFDNLYFSKIINKNLKIKAGKLRLKDNLDYGSSIDISNLQKKYIAITTLKIMMV